MEDPERLLGGAFGADELTLDVLRELRGVSVPREAKEQAWKAIAAQIGAAAVVVSSTQVVAAGAAVSKGAASLAGSVPPVAGASIGLGLKAWLGPSATKLLAAVIVGGAAAGGGALWVQHRATHRDASIVEHLAVPPVRVAPVEEHVAPSPEADVAPPATPEATPDDVAPVATATPAVNEPVRSAAKSPSFDRLAAESALLKTARSELRAGDAPGAERALADSRAKFPNGILGDERTVLTVQVLAAEGNTAAAKRLARGFIATHPKSPYGATLKPLLDH